MSSQPDVPSPATTFRLTSSAFEDGSPIPVEHTCEGENVSPPLRWSGVPEGTKALVLYVDDPDGRDWIHWMVYDMPPTQRSLPYALSPFAEPPRQGRNDFGGQGYAGPCPPSRTHRYFFRLYALAEPLALPRLANGGLVRQGLSRATVLGTAVLMGTFTKGAGGYITGPS